MSQETLQQSNESLSIDDIDKALTEETPEPEENLLEEKKEEEKKEPEEELEIEEEPEDLEITTPVRRKEILTKYPNLFKDFPYLEKAYYREQKYTEIIPSIDDAKELVEKSQNFDRFESDLLSGNTENILKAVHQGDTNAFGKIVDNYLPTLANVDKNAYYHVIGNVIKQTIVSMAREADNLKNDDLRGAAALLNQFIFGTSNFEAPQKFGKASNEQTEESRQLQQERQDLARERFENTQSELGTKVDNILKSTVLQNIDPKGAMSDYVRRTATREALENLDDLIQQDTRFQALKDNLWRKAFENKFDRDSVAAIQRAYLGKAKSLLPEVLKKARNDALRGLGKRVDSEEKSESETRSKKGPIPVGRAASSQQESGKKQIPRGMKTLDFLNQD